MPYLKFDFDALERCPSVAAASGLTADRVAWGLLKTWRHCWRTESVTASDLQLGAHFEAPEVQKLCDALEAFGFIRRQDSAWFVPDIEASIMAKIAQREGGKRGRLASSSQIGRIGVRQPPAQGSLDPMDSPTSTLAQPLTASSKQLAAKKNTTKAKETDPRHAPLVQKLCATYRDVRGGEYGFTPRDAAAVKSLLALGEETEIDRRWRQALTHKGFPEVHSFSELVAHWNRFAVTAGPKPIDAALHFGGLS